MATFDPTPPSFAGVRYDIGNVPNIGAGYAAGIAQAGQGLSEGAKNFMDVMARKQNAGDLIDLFSKHGVLDPAIAADLAKKGLGAQESALGMYAGQWIAQQNQARQLELERQQGAVQVGVERGKYAALAEAYRTGQPVSTDPRNQLWTPPPQPTQPTPPAPAPSQNAILAAQQIGGQYGGGSQVQGQRPPNPTAAPRLPGTRYVTRTDPATGKTQTGTLYPSGQFVAD